MMMTINRVNVLGVCFYQVSEIEMGSLIIKIFIPIELVRIYYITNSVGFSNVSFSDNFNFALF